MSFLLKDVFHQSLVESVYNEFQSGRSNYYYFIGKVLDWSDTANPDTPQVTGEYEYNTRNDIIAVKKINLKDVSVVVPRIDWTADTVYDQYDNNYSADYPSSNNATSLKDANFYVLTNSFGVYKCLFNNNGGLSTEQPFGTDFTPVTYSDGYVWKYLYTIPLSSRNKFLTVDYMPVQTSVTNVFYSDGEISSVTVDNRGSGYTDNALVTLTVNGSFLGRTGNSIANVRPVFNDAGQFIDILVDDAGANYANATIRINDYVGTGNSYFKGVSSIGVYDVGAGYLSNVTANTRVVISTSGNAQPTSNALATPIFSNNVLVGVTLTNPGSGYLANVTANTSISVTTTGSRQPTTNASLTLSYTNTAVLTPVIVGGSLDRVIINDPGINYSANNTTRISLIGDGTGAVLTPFVNSDGEVEEIVVEERGTGYTYLDIQIIGDGNGANAYADLYTGDLDSLQSIIELSAVDGGIYSFRVHDQGNSYQTANITVTGDGSGFIGNVVLYENTVSYISVIDPGVGYTYANVAITGTGTNANVSAIISPAGGHGKNPVKELCADTIMFYSTINNEKNQGITINNDFRQFGIIKNIKTDNDLTFGNLIGSSCFLVTVDDVGSLQRDDTLEITVDDSLREFVIVEVVSATNQLLLQGHNNYTPLALDVLIDPTTEFEYLVTSVDATPDINKFSGDLLYIDNRTSVSYSDQQLVTLRTVVRL